MTIGPQLEGVFFIHEVTEDIIRKIFILVSTKLLIFIKTTFIFRK